MLLLVQYALLQPTARLTLHCYSLQPGSHSTATAYSQAHIACVSVQEPGNNTPSSPPPSPRTASFLYLLERSSCFISVRPSAQDWSRRKMLARGLTLYLSHLQRGGGVGGRCFSMHRLTCQAKLKGPPWAVAPPPP